MGTKEDRLFELRDGTGESNRSLLPTSTFVDHWWTWYGKSSIIQAIVLIHQTLCGRKVILAAPTGKVVQRLNQVQGVVRASTIHRMFGWNPEDRCYKHGIGNADVVIVDEASMIRTRLMYNLLQAIHRGALVIFAGDEEQLPPPPVCSQRASAIGLGARIGSGQMGKISSRRQGDAMRNDYHKSVFNGNFGTVKEIEKDGSGKAVGMSVAFDDSLFEVEGCVRYTKEDVSDLGLAWAGTVHKWQGSKCPSIVLVLTLAHCPLLTRNFCCAQPSQEQREEWFPPGIISTLDATLTPRLQNRLG